MGSGSRGAGLGMDWQAERGPNPYHADAMGYAPWFRPGRIAGLGSSNEEVRFVIVNEVPDLMRESETSVFVPLQREGAPAA